MLSKGRLGQTGSDVAVKGNTTNLGKINLYSILHHVTSPVCQSDNGAENKVSNFTVKRINTPTNE